MDAKKNVALVTDLDGTLLRTDSLWEGFYRMLATKPWLLFSIPFWFVSGRSVLKEKLAPFAAAEASSWPYNRDVLDSIQKARKEGRRVCLATAAHKTVARAVENHLSCFDDVLASESGTNLKGEAKAEKLIQRYGEAGFDYIGDSAADLPVWRHCRAAFFVGSRRSRLFSRLSKECDSTIVIDNDGPGLKTFARVLRTSQWVKNALLFVPLILGRLYTFDNVAMTGLAAIAFSLTSSAIYVINDLVDLPHDRRHDRKRSRPFASGAAPLWIGLPLALVLALAGLVASLYLPTGFITTLVWYLGLTILYSIWLKRVIMLDVIILGGFYVLRIIAGTEAIGAPLSNWLLGFACFTFLGLGLIKRATEIPLRSNITEEERVHGRGYLRQDRAILENMSVASGFCSIAILSLYIESLRAAQFYSRPFYLWGLCPIIAFWYGRLLIIAHRGRMTKDPVSFVMSDKTSILCGLAGLAVVVYSM